jgi:hypothetical protein
MKKRSDEELVLRGYLLGNLDEAVLDDVESRLLDDKAYVARLSLAEDNLIDDYVFNGLSESERESFHTNFLVNEERRNKILIARALEVYVGEERQPVREPSTLTQLWYDSILFVQMHKLWVAFSVVVIVLLAVFVPRMLRSVAPPGAVSPLNAQRANIERQLAELNRYNNNYPALEETVPPFLLREDSVMPKVLVTKDIKVISLKLQLPQGNRYERYRAIVQTAEDVELFSVSDLKTNASTAGEAVTLKVTADVLPTGDYQIRLMSGASEGSEVALYTLRIIHDRP